MFGEEIRKIVEPMSKWIGRSLSFASPNTWTIVSLIFGIIAAYFVYLGQFLAGIVLILFAGFLDYVDGAVARAMKWETKFGAMLDSVVDKVTELAVYFALAFYSANYYFGSLFAASAFMLSSYVSKHAGAIGAKMGGGLLERKERYALILVGLLFLAYQNTCIMYYFLYMIGILSLFTALQRMERTRKFLGTETKKPKRTVK